MPHTPMPDDAEHVTFFIKWWQEFLGMIIISTVALYFKSKGRGNVEALLVPMSEEEIEHRMTICKQSILLAMKDDLDDRDRKLFKHIENQDEKMIKHMKDIFGK